MMTGIPIPLVQPIVGENAFSHESGIHSHGVLACSETFEPGIHDARVIYWRIEEGPDAALSYRWEFEVI